jgi:hypothetical protein
MAIHDDPTKPGKRPLTLKEAKTRFPKQTVSLGKKPGSFTLTNPKTGGSSQGSFWYDPNVKTKTSKEAVDDQLNS